MDKIKLLAVAPYAEMETQLIQIKSNYPQLDLYTFVGYYQNAVDFTKAFPDKNFDVVISRGGTANLLKQLIDTPVVDIGVATIDLLRVMKLAVAQCAKRIFFVSYSHIVKEAKILIDLMKFPIETMSFDTPDEIEEAVHKSKQHGASLIIGGAFTQKFAIECGCQFILISSGYECIQSGIERGLEYVETIRQVRQNASLYQELVNKNESGIFLYDEELKMRFANMEAVQMLNRFHKLEKYLLSTVSKVKKNKGIHITKKIHKEIYRISGRPMTMDRQTFYMLDIRFRSVVNKAESALKIEDTDELYLNKLLPGYSEIYRKAFQKELTAVVTTHLPVLIEGPVGSHKGLIARWIHSHRNGDGNSFLRFNCTDITEKDWKLLINSPDSPLHETGYTICFENIDLLPLYLQDKLADYIRDTNLLKRHNILSSSQNNVSLMVEKGLFLTKLFLQLNGIYIKIPPLKQRAEDLPAMVSMIIAYYNSTLGTSVVAPDAEAMERLTTFEWPVNLVQLERVIRELVVTCGGFYICCQEAEKLIEQEKKQWSPSAGQIQWNGTLDEIEKKIILEVLKEENQNQSAAAKRLGIGRSTLWRKISNIL